SFLTAAAAGWLIENGAALVGIDSNNIEDTRVRARPVHSRLLGADIPICEHMTGLGQLPDQGFRFSAVPPKVRGMGTFPVRAYAVLDQGIPPAARIVASRMRFSLRLGALAVSIHSSGEWARPPSAM